jgi:hypothetical protein
MASPNLAIVHLSDTQRLKASSVNTAIDQLDGAMNSRLDVTVTTADVTLTTGVGGQALSNFFFHCSGAMTGNRNIIVPTNKKRYAVRNATSGAFSLTVKTSGGSGVAVPQGQTQLLYCDGTNVIAVAGPV